MSVEAKFGDDDLPEAGFPPGAHIDAIAIIALAMLKVMTARFGEQFAREVQQAITEEADAMANSPYGDERDDAEVIRAVAHSKVFRELGV